MVGPAGAEGLLLLLIEDSAITKRLSTFSNLECRRWSKSARTGEVQCLWTL